MIISHVRVWYIIKVIMSLIVIQLLFMFMIDQALVVYICTQKFQ